MDRQRGPVRARIGRGAATLFFTPHPRPRARGLAPAQLQTATDAALDCDRLKTRKTALHRPETRNQAKNIYIIAFKTRPGRCTAAIWAYWQPFRAPGR